MEAKKNSFENNFKIINKVTLLMQNIKYLGLFDNSIQYLNLMDSDLNIFRPFDN